MTRALSNRLLTGKKWLKHSYFYLPHIFNNLFFILFVEKKENIIETTARNAYMNLLSVLVGMDFHTCAQGGQWYQDAHLNLSGTSST